MGRTSDAKERLLEVAFDLIWNQSYGAVSVDHICQRAEVNKGSFYHYFPSKSDLAVAAYEEHWREKQPEMDRIFSPQIPPLNRLRLWCGNAYERQKLKAEKYGHVCGCPYASLGAEVATQDEKIRAKAIDDPRLMARRVHSLVLGMLLHAKIRNQFSELEDMEPAVMNLIRAKPAF